MEGNVGVEKGKGVCRCAVIRIQGVGQMSVRYGGGEYWSGKGKESGKGDSMQ